MPYLVNYGGASSSPLQASSHQGGNKYLVECGPEKIIRSRSDKTATAVWFQTEPMSASFISRIQSIRLLAKSRDQGFVSDPLAGNWTWFELSILAKASDWRPKVKDGLSLTWESHQNVMASTSYGLQEGRKFAAQHDLLRFLEDGDVIAARLCAQFPGWEIHAKEGKLVMELSKYTIDRTPPQYKHYVKGVKAMGDIFHQVNRATHPIEMEKFMPQIREEVFHADAFDVGHERPLRVLALDGGGVRGLASLHLLNAVMQKTSPGRKPHEIFDMIGGTSTGGLIAIMLGQLKMSVDECIQKYNALMDKVFCGSKKWSYIRRGEFYNAADLEREIKKLIEQKLGHDDALLLDEDDEEDRCKVFLTATFEHAANNRGPVILRSYTNKLKRSELPGIKLWEAARATSAAPAYFDPIEVGEYKLVNEDLGANNPLGWLWTEVLSVFGPARQTDCFLSIGTGIDANRAAVQPGRIPTFGTIESFASIATNSELTHILFRSLINAFAPLPQTTKYWRLNISEKIPEWDEEEESWFFWTKNVHHPDDYLGMVKLDDTEGARGKLDEMTKTCLNQKDMRDAIDTCARALSIE